MLNELHQILSGFIDLIFQKEGNELHSWMEIGVMLGVVLLVFVVAFATIL